MAAAAVVTVTGAQAVADRLAALEGRSRDFTPALELVADLLEAHVARTFDSRGAVIGRLWPVLAAATLRARLMRWGYYGRVSPRGALTTPLDWSGRLRLSFTPASSDHLRQVTATTLHWGSRLPYAPFQQPRRPMLGFRDLAQQRALIHEPLRLWVQGVPLGAIATVARARAGL